jgi:peroxiredoxin
MALPTDSKAPDFTLKSMGANGLEDFTLGANFGVRSTVLLFFPLAFTGVCTQELCDVTAGLSGYEALEADVIGVSVDSPFAQDAWAKKEKITIRLASDLNKEVINAYDVVFPMLAGVGDAAARAAFVIDKNGVIRYSEQTPTPKELPNFDAIVETLKKLKA